MVLPILPNVCGFYVLGTEKPHTNYNQAPLCRGRKTADRVTRVIYCVRFFALRAEKRTQKDR
jgi:hypothetical protein